MGIVQGFSGLVAARWFLGICESGTFYDLVFAHLLDSGSTMRAAAKHQLIFLSYQKHDFKNVEWTTY